MSFGIIDCAPPIEKEKAHAGDHQRIDYSYENLPVIGSEKNRRNSCFRFYLSFLKKFNRRAPILCGALDRIAVMQSASFALFVTSLQITWQRTRMFGR
jgi:hypothetical protein